MDDTAVIYGLDDFQARALVAQCAETEKINFLVGTQSLRNINQIQLIEFDDDTGVVSKQVFEHEAGEVWCLASAPQSTNIVASVHSKVEDGKSHWGSSIWKLNTQGSIESSQKGSLDLQCTLNTSEDQHWLGWAPEDDSRLASVGDDKVNLWSLDAGCSEAKIVGEASTSAKSTTRLGRGRWCCHHGASQFAATHGANIIAWDSRSMKQVWCIEGAHPPIVRDLDFNPNRQYFLASCGDDGAIRVWDTRNVNNPVLSRSDHSHWVWSVRFNASYDHLVASCSSDQRVILCSLPSAASKTPGMEEEEDGKQGVDRVVSKFEEHEESVYCVEWSTADCWTMASLSYDGRIVFNKVPKSEKYKHFM